MSNNKHLRICELFTFLVFFAFALNPFFLLRLLDFVWEDFAKSGQVTNLEGYLQFIAANPAIAFEALDFFASNVVVLPQYVSYFPFFNPKTLFTLFSLLNFDLEFQKRLAQNWL